MFIFNGGRIRYIHKTIKGCASLTWLAPAHLITHNIVHIMQLYDTQNMPLQESPVALQDSVGDPAHSGPSTVVSQYTVCGP